MAPALDLTSFNAALKEYYTPDAVKDMVYKNNPLLALVKKSTDFPGKYKDVPIVYGNPQGRSATFSRAQTRGQSSSSKIGEFLVTRAKDYAVATIDNETILASQSDKGAFMRAATLEFDGAINSLKRAAAIDLFRSGYGAIGRIKVGSTVASATTITLDDIEEVTNFEVGQELVVTAAEASGALRALGTSGNGLIVTKVNRSTGVLTFGAAIDDAADGIPAIAHSDYIFVRGDRQDAASPSRLKISGLEAWLPATAPTTGDSFFGLDRSADPTRLAGCRQDLSGVPIEEALIEGAAIVGREGGIIDHYFMPFSKWSALQKALGSKVQYADLKVGTIGFRSIRINGPKGEIMCVPDMNCPSNRCFGLQLDVWELATIGDLPRVIDTDDLDMLRMASADGVESRWGYYGNLCCSAPGWNINIQW